MAKCAISNSREPEYRRSIGAEVTDAELLLAASSDPDSFGVFYYRHFDSVLHYFGSRTQDYGDASDLTAETFAAALDTVDRFDPERGNGAQWLYGIAGNQLKRFWRRKKTDDRARKRLQIKSLPLMTGGRSDIEAADARLDGPRILAALERIPTRNREAVRLRVVEERDYDHIGRILGCKPGAARVRVLRGLRRLEYEFGADPFDEVTG